MRARDGCWPPSVPISLSSPPSVSHSLGLLLCLSLSSPPSLPISLGLHLSRCHTLPPSLLSPSSLSLSLSLAFYLSISVCLCECGACGLNSMTDRERHTLGDRDAGRRAAASSLLLPHSSRKPTTYLVSLSLSLSLCVSVRWLRKQTRCFVSVTSVCARRLER